MLKKIALRTFGGLVGNYIDYFDTLKTNLKKANIVVSVHEYVSTLIFFTFITFLIVLIIGSILITFAFLYSFYSFTLTVLISFMTSGFVFFLGYYYPSLKAKGIKARIDKSMPFAVFYMTTTASSGVNPIEIFKMLSLRGGVIGEEAKKIYTNVTTLGMNLTTALQKAATKTPSQSFADLLWGMMAIITTGGDLEEYLKDKTKILMNQYRRTLNDYAKQISLYTEIYITLITVGTLFFIILIAMIAPLVGISILFLQAFLVFFFVPLISIGFIVLLKALSPTE
jgi:flagellar protein FlaJ